MAVGKNKRLSKGGKRSSKKKLGDIMTNKEWYDIVAPASFKTRHCGKTLVNKSKGTFSGPDAIKGRVFEANLADLMNGSDDDVHKCRKVFLRAEDVQGRNVLTQFHGMALNTDKIRALVQKWCTIIEGECEVKTNDGYTLRVFAFALTKKRQSQVKKNCHCQTSHVKKIREKMAEKITESVTKSSLDKIVRSFQQDAIGEDIRKACLGIFPLTGCCIRKVKVVKAPKFDAARLIDVTHDKDVPVSKEGGRQLQAAPVEEEKKEEVNEADD